MTWWSLASKSDTAFPMVPVAPTTMIFRIFRFSRFLNKVNRTRNESFAIFKPKISFNKKLPPYRAPAQTKNRHYL
jgi:hypothetical protein